MENEGENILKNVFENDQGFSLSIVEIEKDEKRLDKIESELRDPDTLPDDKKFLEDEKRTIIKKLGKLKEEMESNLEEVPVEKKRPQYPDLEG